MSGQPTRTLELERHYNATPERVFAAWTELDLLTTWWGCAPDMLWDVHEYDVRVGGTVRVSMPFDGVPFEISGEFLAVEPPHHLRYTFGDEVVDVRIEPDGDGTRLMLRHEELAGAVEEQRVTEGWTDAVRRLGEQLGQPAASS